AGKGTRGSGSICVFVFIGSPCGLDSDLLLSIAKYFGYRNTWSRRKGANRYSYAGEQAGERDRDGPDARREGPCRATARRRARADRRGGEAAPGAALEHPLRLSLGVAADGPGRAA